MSTLRVKLTNSVPTPIIDFIQVIVSALIPYALTYLVTAVGNLHQPALAFYIAATGLYYAAVSSAERKWPTWAWLFYLLPTNLPTAVEETADNK
jgi:hypothetical protein